MWIANRTDEHVVTSLYHMWKYYSQAPDHTSFSEPMSVYLNSPHMSMFICFICSERDFCCNCFSKQQRQRSHLLASAAMVFFDTKILIVTTLHTCFHHDMDHFTDSRALHSGIIYVLPIIGSHVLVVNKLIPWPTVMILKWNRRPCHTDALFDDVTVRTNIQKSKQTMRLSLAKSITVKNTRWSATLCKVYWYSAHRAPYSSACSKWFSKPLPLFLTVTKRGGVG